MDFNFHAYLSKAMKWVDEHPIAFLYLASAALLILLAVGAAFIG
jgi:hypothetical protein